MAEYVLSAFSDEYDDDLRTQCEALNRFGIGYTEIRHFNGKNVLELTEAEAKSAKKLLDEHGIKVSAIGSPIGKIAVDADLNKHLSDAEHIFNVANIFDTEFIRIFSFYSGKQKNVRDGKDTIVSWFEKALILAEQYGVSLCHENEALIFGESPEKCSELINEFNGRLGCVFDMGNFVLDGYDAIEAYETLKDHIAYFHLKDALSAGAIVPAGKGEAKIEEILSKHKNVMQGNVFVTLEPHLQTFTGLNALVGKKFDNPYKYKDQKAAFTDAVNKIKVIMQTVNGN